MNGINLLGIKYEQRSKRNCSTHIITATLNPNYSSVSTHQSYTSPQFPTHSASPNYSFIELYQLLGLFNHWHPTATLTTYGVVHKGRLQNTCFTHPLAPPHPLQTSASCIRQCLFNGTYISKMTCCSRCLLCIASMNYSSWCSLVGSLKGVSHYLFSCMVSLSNHSKSGALVSELRVLQVMAHLR